MSTQGKSKACNTENVSQNIRIDEDGSVRCLSTKPSDIIAIQRIIEKYGDNGYLMNHDVDKLIPLLRILFTA